MHKISFPGLGIDEFTVDSTAFWTIKWYGIIITFGMIVAVTYVYLKTKKQKLLFDDLLDIAIFTVIFGVIGARVYYVLTSLEEYHSFKEAIASERTPSPFSVSSMREIFMRAMRPTTSAGNFSSKFG